MLSVKNLSQPLLKKFESLGITTRLLKFPVVRFSNFIATVKLGVETNFGIFYQNYQ